VLNAAGEHLVDRGDGDVCIGASCADRSAEIEACPRRRSGRRCRQRLEGEIGCTRFLYARRAAEVRE